SRVRAVEASERAGTGAAGTDVGPARAMGAPVHLLQRELVEVEVGRRLQVVAITATGVRHDRRAAAWLNQCCAIRSALTLRSAEGMLSTQLVPNLVQKGLQTILRRRTRTQARPCFAEVRAAPASVLEVVADVV